VLIAMTPAAYEPMFRVAKAAPVAAAGVPQMADART
jgi:hypothetical protein